MLILTVLVIVLSVGLAKKATPKKVTSSSNNQSSITTIGEYRAVVEGLFGSEYNKNWMYLMDVNDVAHYIPLEDYERTSGEAYIGATTVSKVDKVLEFRYYKSPESFKILNYKAKVNNKKLTFKDAPIKIITHDWYSSADFEGLVQLRDAYLQKKRYNVIVLDWKSVANSKDYEAVANNTKAIGEFVGIFIKALRKDHDHTDEIHLIGLGMGAHIMGVAGKSSGGLADRITGLDPLRPHFEFPAKPDDQRLDLTDAFFVDIIHTCAEFAGYGGNRGHVDFYPNGGFAPQPNCGDDLLESCSHRKSLEYFTESVITPNRFASVRCRNWKEFKLGKCEKTSSTVVMGENANKNSYGLFFLDTKSDTQNTKAFVNKNSIKNLKLNIKNENKVKKLNKMHKMWKDSSDSSDSSDTDSDSSSKSDSDNEEEDEDEESADEKTHTIVNCNNLKDDKNCLTNGALDEIMIQS